jgi:hypothetical protein
VKTLLLLALFSMPICRAEVPELFRERSFNAVTLANAVNHFVALGEADAVRELTELAPDHKAMRPDGIDLPERVGWVCRILFSPKGDKPLRPPGYGGHSLPHLSMPLDRWPLYPIAASGKSFFVLSEGYHLRGLAERPMVYLAYCQKSGNFRKDPIPVPTKDEAQKDAAALRESVAWKAIRWTDEGPGTRYTMDEASIWKFIQAQADAIR